MIFISREDQDDALKSAEADEIARGSQEEPENLKDNPANLFVSNTPQFAMSADAVYSTIDEGNGQNVLSHNPVHFSLEKSVASLDKSGHKFFLHVLMAH